MKIRKVSADVLETSARYGSRGRTMSPREKRRLELERKLETVINEADQSDGSTIFRITPESDKPASIRAAFRRVKERLAVADVNLRTASGDMYIGKMPPSGRGRKPKSS